MYLGDYIVIDHQIGPFEFACESVSTGTPFIAKVDEDKRDIFRDQSFPENHPHACRFLRPDGYLNRCTIHTDSPAQCKFYRCVIMEILDAEGDLRGVVTGTLHLHSEDPLLRATWEEAERNIPESEPGVEEERGRFLSSRGYRIR